MKIKNKIIFISLILLVLLSITCVSATQEADVDNTLTASEMSVSEVLTSSDVIQSNESFFENSVKLGVSADSQMNVINYNDEDNTYLEYGAASTKFIAPDRTINIGDAVNGYDYQVILRDANGNGLAGKEVSFNFNGKTSTGITDSNGWATAKLTSDTSGTYDVEVTFKGDANYAKISQIATIKIIKNEVNFVAPDRTLYLDEISSGYTYPVILRDTEGNPLSKKQVTLIFNGKNIVQTTDNRGYCYFTITADKEGSYGVTLRFAGDQYYYGKSCSNFKTVEVIVKKNVTFIAPDRTLHVEDIEGGYTYPVLLRDSDGKALANKKITLTFNGNKLTGTTNSKGYCYFNLTVNRANSYPITLNFAGDKYYYANSALHFKTVNVIKWNVTFIAPDRSIYLDEISGGYIYPVLLRDSNGKALANKKITLTFNGKTLEGTTDNKGYCYFNLKVNQEGLYKVSLKFAGDRYCNSKFANNFKTVEVIVMKNVVFVAPDRTISLADIEGGYSYPVLLRDSNGKALANKKITITFNGKKLTGTTDSKGYCYFNLKVDKVGSYGITFEFAGDKYNYPNLSPNYRTVNVKDGVIFIAEDEILVLKDISSGYNYLVILEDYKGYGLANKKISITFNGMKLTGTTDNRGYCYFNLRVDRVGSYDITFEFEGDNNYYPSSLINYRTIIVGKDNAFFVVDERNIPINEIYTGYNFPVTLKDSNGNPVANKWIIFNFNGMIFTGITNNMGMCYFNINHQMLGAVYVAISFDGDDYFTPVWYSNTLWVVQATNPYGTANKKVWIVADTGSDDMKLAVANLISTVLGWDVFIGGTGPGYHYTDYFNELNRDDVYIVMCNGFCAGSVREAYSDKIQNVLRSRGVQLVMMWDTRDWTNPAGMAPYRYGDFSGYKAGRAWDDDFSKDDPTIEDVGQWLKMKDAKYCANPTAEGLLIQFMAGGYFAYVGQ